MGSRSVIWRNGMNWISFLAEQRMAIIEPYSAEHIILSVSIFIAALLLAMLLRRISVNKSGLCFSVGVILAVSELLKQFVLTEYLEHYPWMDFPFQLCSMPMFLCLLYPACKKRRKCFETFFSTFGLLGGLAALAEPSSSLTEVPFLTGHSLIWHGILLFLGFFFIPQNKKGDYRKSARLYLILAAMAILLNFFLTGPSGASINLFFLGPNYPGIIGLTTIWQKYGWIAESFIMMAATVFGAYLIFEAGRLLYGKNGTTNN